MQLQEGQFSRLLSSLGRAGVESERRRARRIPLVARGTVRVVDRGRSGTFSVLTRDLSQRGLNLIAAAPIDCGLHISVELPDGNGALVTLQCQVRHCRAMADGLWGIGAQFVDTAEPDQQDQLLPRR